MDLKNMMKQVQDIQGRINSMQGELAEKTIETSSGGGMVTVTANGKQEIISINISPEIIETRENIMNPLFYNYLSGILTMYNCGITTGF